MKRAEDYVVLTGFSDSAPEESLPDEVLEKLLSYPVDQVSEHSFECAPQLQQQLSRRKTETLSEISDRNLQYFETEVEKLDAWADDLKAVLEQEIKEADREINEVRRTAKVAPDLQEKLHWQKRQRELEKLRNKKRRELFDKQDDVDDRRETLITLLEEKMEQSVEECRLFSMCWSVM